MHEALAARGERGLGERGGGLRVDAAGLGQLGRGRGGGVNDAVDPPQGVLLHARVREVSQQDFDPRPLQLGPGLGVADQGADPHALGEQALGDGARPRIRWLR